MRWVLTAILGLHGLIHLMGFAKAFGLAQLEALKQPVSRPLGVLWLVAAVLVLVAATLRPALWPVSALALVLSQAVIITSWSDAKFGTVANVALLGVVAWGFAAEGPLGLRAEFRRDVEAEAKQVSAGAPVTEAELAPLPLPVQRYLRVSGVVGKPRPGAFKATWRGRIRGGPTEPWMDFTAEQLNTFGALPGRLFLMDATMKGLPVDVFHRFVGDAATYRVRVLSAVQVTEGRGPEMNRAETVTIFNDLCLLAPARLLDPSIRWEPLDDTHARAHFRRGAEEISAELVFAPTGELLDFVSDDRLRASSDGKSFTPMRWTTPLREIRAFGDVRLAAHGDARWEDPAGGFAYGEFDLQTLEYR